MAYTVLNQFNSGNFTGQASVPSIYGMPRSIDYITIHWWGDPNQGPTFENVVAWLCNPRSQVSAHDVITGTGRRVAVLVDYPNAAWHSGSARGNATSLGFELDPRCRQEDYETAAEDIADTWRYYGRVIPLKPHREWTATACPGNYDLNRLHNMAMELYNGAPAKQTASAAEVQQAYREVLEREADAGGLHTYTTNGMNIAEVRADLYASNERKQLEERKKREAEEYAKNEWVRNKNDIVAAKFSVIPAEGARVYDLVTLQPKGDAIPKGTIIDIVFETTVKGEKYLLSSYAVQTGVANGLKASELGIPTTPPEQEKPEWLKNLKDIEDKDMWARSAAPVLNIENGDVVRSLKLGEKVRITHATQIVGKNLLVVEGGKEVIETLYLTDTEPKDPTKDLEVRVTALEAIVKGIQSFLTELFKNFKK